MSRHPFVRPQPGAGWYLGHARYRSYMLREAPCVLVAIYCGLLLAALAVLASGEATRWEDFLAAQQRPAWLAFHALSLVFFTVYQSAAWFRLAPKAMPLPANRFPSAARLVVAAHYLAWLVLSALVLRLAGVI